ncbi:MAG: FHA domain-containing protein, partial [Thermoanaerobaculia bacterium]|nr:FHA domain-containing protein [Thermoanaerobaculia bacterium]
ASTNGTFVNGVRVTKPRVLSHGDLIRFGNVEYRLWVKPQVRN